MTIYAWDRILEILMANPGVGFKTDKLCEITGLPRHYVSSYLTRWKTAGILGHDKAARKYILINENKALLLISRGVDATSLRDSPRVPPTKLTPHPHNPRVAIPVKFDQDNIDKWVIHLGIAGPGMITPPAPGDRGRQITITSEYMTATVSLNTLRGTITVFPGHEKDYLQQIGFYFGAGVLDQVKTKDLVYEWEDSFDKSFLRALNKIGKKIGFEIPGSKEPGNQVEYHGFTPRQMQAIQGKVIVKDLEERVSLGLIFDQIQGLNREMEGIKVAVHLQTQAQGQQTRVLLDISNNITESLGKHTNAIRGLVEKLGALLTQGQDLKPGATVGPAEPYRGHDPGVG